MPLEYLQKTDKFLKRTNIYVTDTNDKKEIKESKSFITAFTPSKEKTA